MQPMYIVLYLHLVKCYVKKQYRIDMFGSSTVMISHLIVLSLSNKLARTREHTSIVVPSLQWKSKRKFILRAYSPHQIQSGYIPQFFLLLLNIS